MKHFHILPILVILLATAVPALAQFGPPDDDDARSRLMELRRLKMIEALDLNEEQAVRLTVREKEFRSRETEARKARESEIEQLRSLLNSDADDESILSALKSMDDAAVSSIRRRHEYLLSLRDFLSTEQIARMVIFEHQFARQIKKILGKSRPPHPPKR